MKRRRRRGVGEKDEKGRGASAIAGPFLLRCWTHCIKTSWTVFFGAALTIIIEARAVSILALNNSGRAQSFVPCCWCIVCSCMLSSFIQPLIEPLLNRRTNHRASLSLLPSPCLAIDLKLARRDNLVLKSSEYYKMLQSGDPHSSFCDKEERYAAISFFGFPMTHHRLGESKKRKDGQDDGGDGEG